MSTVDEPKPLFWVGTCRKDVKAFPAEVRQLMGFALFQAQNGDKHIDAKPLRGFGGAGVLEVIDDHRGATFRAVYTVQLAGAVYALHAFQKKSKKGVKAPKSEVDLIHKRLRAAREHYETWRAAQDDASAGNH